jgi:Flp pilus assembly protein TadG
MKHISPPRLNKRSARQHGSVIVEFALVLTLLITLMAGIFEFGRAFWYYDTLSKATRDGARLMAMVATTDIASGVGLTQTRVVNAVSAAGVPNFLATNVTVTCLNAAYAVITCANVSVTPPVTPPAATPWGVRVQIVGYTMTMGQFIPFLIGANSNYTTTLSPHTTMRYMPLGTLP